MLSLDPSGSFRAPWGGDDDAISSHLVSNATLTPDAEKRVDA